MARRIEHLMHLTPEQDLEVVKLYMAGNSFTQRLAPENRGGWYEQHRAHAKRYATTVVEQIVISAEMADQMGGTDRATDLLVELEAYAASIE